MHRISLYALLISSVIFPKPVDASSLKSGKDLQETIWSLETAYFAHLYNAEHEKLLALVHPSFLGWPGSVPKPMDREGSADFMRKFASKPLPCELQIEKMGIEIQGAVALTQYVLHVRCNESKGVSTRSSRICHTWVQDGAAWKLLGGMSIDMK